MPFSGTLCARDLDFPHKTLPVFMTRFSRPVGTLSSGPPKRRRRCRTLEESPQSRAVDQGVAGYREPLMLVEAPLFRLMRGFDRLNDLKSFEFRVAERKRLTLASLLMGGPELFGLGPGREIILCRPYCMR